MKRILLILLLTLPILSGYSALAETKRALLIGISDYGNEMEDPTKWDNINGVNDIKILSPLFKEQGFQVSTLVDGQATHDGIINALKNIIKDSEPGDVVYVHFSMHGQPFEDLNGDEEDGWDEALIPVDAQMEYKEGVYEGQNHLLDDELEIYFNDIRTKIGPTGNLYVVLDACHSGSASRGDNSKVRGVKEGFTRSGKPYIVDRTKESNDYFDVDTKPGQSPVMFVEACRSYQANKEVRDKTTNKWYGPLSFYIAQAMENNEIVGSEGWLESIRKEMDKKTKQNMVIERSK